MFVCKRSSSPWDKGSPVPLPRRHLFEQAGQARRENSCWWHMGHNIVLEFVA